MPRSLADMLGREAADDMQGSLIELSKKIQSSPPYQPEPNSQPLGAGTGAPPRVIVRALMISPFGAPGGATLVVEPSRASRIATFTAPLVGFSIFIGDAGVKVGDFSLPPGLPYDIPLPGFQELYAVTDAPVLLSLKMVISPILVGDLERSYGAGP